MQLERSFSLADDPAGRENGAALSSSNHLLDRVPPDERARMDDRLEPVLLEAGQVLYEPGQPLTHVFLPLTGMISLVAVMSDGRTAEGMTIGREGAAGLSASGYVDDAFNRYVVQLPGSGYRVKAEDFEDLVDESVEFCSAVTRWREVMVRMSLQSVACNALHRSPAPRALDPDHPRSDRDRQAALEAGIPCRNARGQAKRSQHRCPRVSLDRSDRVQTRQDLGDQSRPTAGGVLRMLRTHPG